MSTSSGVYDVHLGRWTDWSRGQVLGATLTLTRQDSGLLIAFLAFFVALVGTRFWRIVCLILHWSFSKDSPADGVHHQRQAFLRNSSNPESALWTLTDMCLSWRRNATRVWSRLLPLIALALACFVGFILAGGYSSQVTTFGTSEVLLSGANCAFVGDVGVTMNTYGSTIGPMITQAMIAAESYARQCYNPSSAPQSPSCSSAYVRKQLPPVVVDTNASCPFDPKVCQSQRGNLFIDTGFLDSYYDLGRNTPPSQRMQLRRTFHCAPLATENYRVIRNHDAHNESWDASYYYGPPENDMGNGTTSDNYTTRYSSAAYPETEELTENFAWSTERDFGIRTHYAMFWNGTHYSGMSSFNPIPELRPMNGSGSVWIRFLTSDNILFTQQTEDSWYGRDMMSTQVHKLKGMEWGNVTMFRQSIPGSPLGCQEMEQLCFTGVKGVQICGRLGSAPDSVMDIESQMEPEDKEWYIWFMTTTFETMTQARGVVDLLGTRALRARDSLNGPILGSLPEGQWQIEVQHWHATATAHLQETFLRSIIGPSNPELPKLMEVWYPNTTVEKEICASQKVVLEGYVSFSIFAIVCIFLGGGLIILLSLKLESILAWCLTCRGDRTKYSRLEWSANETLQIQRLAHEATGAGTWSRTTGTIPVTKPGDVLAVLDIGEPAHPRLRAPRTEDDRSSGEGERSDTPLDVDEKIEGGLGEAVVVMRTKT